MDKLSRNFSDWFTFDEGDKLLVSTHLRKPITRTMPSVLLVLRQTIVYFRKTVNHNEQGKLRSAFNKFPDLVFLVQAFKIAINLLR